MFVNLDFFVFLFLYFLFCCFVIFPTVCSSVYPVVCLSALPWPMSDRTHKYTLGRINFFVNKKTSQIFSFATFSKFVGLRDKLGLVVCVDVVVTFSWPACDPTTRRPLKLWNQSPSAAGIDWFRFVCVFQTFHAQKRKWVFKTAEKFWGRVSQVIKERWPP